MKANAVARIDNLEFLSDVIPRTTTFKEYKEKKARLVGPLPNGQTTLGKPRSLPQRPVGMNGFEDSRAANGTGYADPNHRDVEKISRNNGNEVSQTHDSDSNSEQDEQEDVEMG